MYYVILDSTGNLVESFDSREEALTHLQRLIDSNPDAADDLAMLTYGGDGIPVGEAVQIKSPSSSALI